MSSEELYEEGLHVEGDEGDRGGQKIMDAQYMKTVKEELTFIEKELNTATQNNDLSQIPKLEEKKDQLLSFLQKNGLFGRSRRWSEKIRSLKNVYRKTSTGR